MNIFQSRMNELYELINYHAGLYYDKDSPEISDFEYDSLVRELNDLERDHPEFVRKNFLTHNVGGSASNFLFSIISRCCRLIMYLILMNSLIFSCA